ncbi:MAG: type II toxin-antitoxin system HipA family toxin [Gammaproteobacteria bacterium]|nr:type II toxin-antitoxin system HipA family toxin [Gammaproteobacteria bacterium]
MYDDTLNVWTNSHHVGYLWRDERNEMGFQYSHEWLENPVRFPVSKTLPLTSRAYEPGSNNRVAHNYFANLLPEADSRRRICREKKISYENDFDLLRAIGGECAGALSILANAPQETPNQYRELNDDDLAKLLTQRNPSAVVAPGDNPPRLSLAGAQDKTPVKYAEGRFYIPLDNAISTHILKYSVRDINNVPAYETITMWTAEELELDVCKIDYFSYADESFTLSARYDRAATSDGLVRLHQEDFCQASGRSSANKYEQEGGLTFAECLHLVREHSTQPLKDIPRLIRWQIFNCLVGNADAHAKNLSFLYGHDNTTRLSPFYDIIAIHAWPPHVINHELALSIGGETNIHKITRTHWERLADECDTSFKLFDTAIKELSAGIVDAFERARQRFEEKHGEFPAFQQVGEVLHKNQRLLVKAFKKS